MSRSELLRRPERLFGPSVAVWDRVAPPALKDGRLTAASLEAFTAYCEVRALVDEVRDMARKGLPLTFLDPAGHTVVHPIKVSLADLLEAALEMEHALGVGPLGEAEWRRRGGELGAMLDCWFNIPHDLHHHLGLRSIPGGQTEGSGVDPDQA
ncbi:MAG: hypothetical protein Q8N53_09860 [Longimicrobiales bacterium]|nr:hypothetical protein [Longimicrobiales bacterium]